MVSFSFMFCVVTHRNMSFCRTPLACLWRKNSENWFVNNFCSYFFFFSLPHPYPIDFDFFLIVDLEEGDRFKKDLSLAPKKLVNGKAWVVEMEVWLDLFLLRGSFWGWRESHLVGSVLQSITFLNHFLSLRIVFSFFFYVFVSFWNLCSGVVRLWRHKSVALESKLEDNPGNISKLIKPS